MVMLWIWAIPLGQPPCKLAGLKRKSSITLEFKAGPGIVQHLEESAERDSIVKILSSSA